MSHLPNRSSRLLAIGLLAGCHPAAAQAQSVGATGKATTEVSATVAQVHRALVAADSSALRPLTAPKLTVGHANGTVQDRAAFLAAGAGGRPDYAAIETTGQTIQLLGSMALARHTSAAIIADNSALKMNTLLVMQKRKGHWVLLARQAVRVG